MNIRRLIFTAALAGIASPASAVYPVIDKVAIVQAGKQVQAWAKQYSQMASQIAAAREQIRAMTGDRGMAAVLPAWAPAIPADWADSMTHLSATAQEIRRTQAMLTPRQASFMSPQLQLFLAQAQSLSAANQAMAQTAFNDAAAREARLRTLTATLARTVDPKAAFDLANRIAIEHAALLKDQNQLESAANGAAAQNHAQRLMGNQLRVATAGTEIPNYNMSRP